MSEPDSLSIPADERPRSRLGVIAFIMTIAAPVLMIGVSLDRFSIGPLFGFLGTLGAILGIVDRHRTRSLESPYRRTSLAIFAIALGFLETLPATACAGCWFVEPQQTKKGSCPHVYAFDGAALHLDADALSGALLEGAEREDRVRLDHLRPVEGRYRLVIRDELQETDSIDELALLAVDHPPGTEVLPDPTGAPVLLGPAAPPVAARDQIGRDLRAPLARRDDSGVTGRAADYPADADPRMQLTVEFTRPAGAPVLVLRARNTWFGEEVFARYFARLGSGSTKLIEWAGAASKRPFRDLLLDEMRRLGLLLKIEVNAGGRFTTVAELLPFGPAVARDMAIPLPAPAPADGPIAVRLEMTPLLWSVDAAQLAARDDAPIRPRRLDAITARDGAGCDLTALLAAADGRRLVLHTGEEATLEFAAPPVAPDRIRTVLVALRGYYELGAGRDRPIDLVALWRDRTGRDSLGRAALRAARATQGDIEMDPAPGR